MTLWESIKKNAEEGLEALKDRMSVLVAETGRTSRILKRRVELTSLQGHVRRTFIRLGILVYELRSKGDQEIFQDEGVKALMAEIDGYKARVREIEAEIERINQEEARKTSGKANRDGASPPVDSTP